MKKSDKVINKVDKIRDSTTDAEKEKQTQQEKRKKNSDAHTSETVISILPLPKSLAEKGKYFHDTALNQFD